MKIKYSPFVCLKLRLILNMLKSSSISVNFQGQSLSSHVFTCRQVRWFEPKSRNFNEYALDAGTNEQLLKAAKVHVSTRMHALIDMFLN